MSEPTREETDALLGAGTYDAKKGTTASQSTLAADVIAKMAEMDAAQRKAHLKSELDMIQKALEVILPLVALEVPALAPFTPGAIGAVEAIVKGLEAQ